MVVKKVKKVVAKKGNEGERGRVGREGVVRGQGAFCDIGSDGRKAKGKKKESSMKDQERECVRGRWQSFHLCC